MGSGWSAHRSPRPQPVPPHRHQYHSPTQPVGPRAPRAATGHKSRGLFGWSAWLSPLLKQATILASRRNQHCKIFSAYICIYIPIYIWLPSGSRVKVVTGSRTRSTGRSPRTERERITAQRNLDAAVTTRASRPGGCQGQGPPHIPLRRMGQDPMREVQKPKRFLVAGTAKASADQREGRMAARQGRDSHEARCAAQQPGPQQREGRRHGFTPEPNEPGQRRQQAA